MSILTFMQHPRNISIAIIFFMMSNIALTDDYMYGISIKINMTSSLS
jgi:hypothetical protein